MVNVAVGAGVSQTAVEIFTTARHNYLSGSQSFTSGMGCFYFDLNWIHCLLPLSKTSTRLWSVGVMMHVESHDRHKVA